MPHATEAGSALGAFLEGGVSGFERGTELRGRRRDRQRFEEEHQARLVGERLLRDRGAERFDREGTRFEREGILFDLDLADRGLGRIPAGQIPGEPSAPGPFRADESGVVQRLRSDAGADLAGDRPLPAGLQRIGPSLDEREQERVLGLRRQVASELGIDPGLAEALGEFGLLDDAFRASRADDPSSPFQLKEDASGLGFNFDPRSGELTPAMLPGGEQFRGRTAGGATSEAFVRRGEAVIARAQDAVDDPLARFREDEDVDPDAALDAALQQEMGVDLATFRRIQSEFYSELLGADADEPVSVGTRGGVRIPPGFQAQIAENIARGDSTSSRGLGLGNRDAAASTLPDSSAQVSKRTVTADQAEFLKTTQGMTDAEINALYNVIR